MQLYGIKHLTDYGYIRKTVYCHGNTVYVKTEITPTDDDVVLEWGKSLISARTKTDLAAQLSAVTATGWDMKEMRRLHCDSHDEGCASEDRRRILLGGQCERL